MMNGSPNPALTTDDVLEALQASGKPLQKWGQAIDGTPLLAARTGGDQKPPIFITAGAHSTETAGVHAALDLLHTLDTPHEVHVLPLRDPFGFSGVNHCLTFAAGEPVEVPDHDGALEYLASHAKPIWREGKMYIFKLGDLGFMWYTSQQPGIARFMSMYSRLLSLTGTQADKIRPLWGKRLMLLNAMPDVEGAGETGRCWHAVLDAHGEWMHVNRFFGRPEAPSEVTAVDRLMQALHPGLTCDLHEGNGPDFWMPICKPKENPEQVFQMTQAYFDYIHSQGYPITTYEDWIATDETHGKNYAPDWMQPEPRLPGMFWSDGLLRGEGYNLGDYAGLFGVGYGTEAPMEQPLSVRVDGIINGIKAAIRVWEQTSQSAS
jgi:hypothetical protein